MSTRKTWAQRAFSIVTVFFLLGILSISSARGDLLIFRRGGRLECQATIRGETVVVASSRGPIEFPRADFVSITPSTPAEDLWPPRREAALRGTAQDRCDAVFWAMEHGLTFECEKLLRLCVSLDRDHLDPALVRMLSALDRLSSPRPDPELSSLTKVLPSRFESLSGRLFLLLHRKSSVEAADRLALLEQVSTTFFLWTAAHGFELPAPERKLVCIWFDDRDAYSNFLRLEGASAFADTSGYFHPTRRLIALRDSPAESSASPSFSSSRDSARLHLLSEQTRLSIDLGASAHEAIHLLVFSTGLSPRCDSFPIWLHEGLAMQFECVRFGRWAGISQVSPIRYSHLRRLDSPALLSTLVRDLDFHLGYSYDRYAQAWSLVFHLLKHHPLSFFSYLDQLRVPVFEPPSDPSSRFLTLFQTCFGADLRSLEHSWRSSISSLRSPLDTP